LKEAADGLRSLVEFLGDNRGPWYVTIPESGYPQSISNKGVPYCVADVHESPSIPVFTIAPYIAAMHPGVGRALADWLDSWTGIELSEGAALPEDASHALAVARAINANR
jgi:hypothetical protein